MTKPSSRAGCCRSLALLAALPLMIAGGRVPPARAASPTGVSVTGAWFERTPNAPLLGYFTIVNDGDHAVLITQWTSPDCQQLSLQEAAAVSGAKTLDNMTVPAKDRMAFAHGSYHLMCAGPSQAAEAATSIPVTVGFRSGRTLQASFVIHDIHPH